jgi:hypothetical protein
MGANSPSHKKHRMRVFENRVLWRVFGLKREEVTRERRKLHNLSSSSNMRIASMIK